MKWLSVITTNWLKLAPKEKREGRDVAPCGGHSGQPGHGQEAH